MPAANPITLVYITPQNGASVYGSPLGQTVSFGLLGDAQMTAASGGTGGWQIIDRPRLPAATQWFDRSPWQLTLPLRLDVDLNYGGPISPPQPGTSPLGTLLNVEDICLSIESWSDAVPGTLQAPVLQIAGPVPGSGRQWVIYQTEWKNAIRDPLSGSRIAQELTFTLYEYIPPQSSADPFNPQYAPAAAANQAVRNAAVIGGTSGQSTSQYTITASDVANGGLGTIAAQRLGNYYLWPTIAYLNNIRDPSSIVAGQVILLPTVNL